MRKALNENPMVQIAILAVLAVGVGLLLLTRMGGGSDTAATSPTSPTTASTAPTTGAPATSTDAAAAPAPATPDPSTTAPSAPAPSTDAPATSPDPAVTGGVGEFTAGPGLPQPVVTAYEGGSAVVLLVYRRKGIDDVFVNTSVRLLKSSFNPVVSGAAVFFTNAHNISRYSRITEGVSVSRTPALIVIKPKDLSDGVPLASVSYGFRDPQSVVQAVEDALYDGPQVPSYPE